MSDGPMAFTDALGVLLGGMDDPPRSVVDEVDWAHAVAEFVQSEGDEELVHQVLTALLGLGVCHSAKALDNLRARGQIGSLGTTVMVGADAARSFLAFNSGEAEDQNVREFFRLLRSIAGEDAP